MCYQELTDRDDRSRPQFLSAPAQLLVLLHLQKEPIDNLSLAEPGRRLKYSRMTMSRVFSDLIGARLAEGITVGSRKYIRFRETGKKLWKKVEPMLRSPVRSRSNARLPLDVYTVESGMTALARLIPGQPSTPPEYAIDQRRYLALKKGGTLEEPLTDAEDAVLESWAYDPALVGKEGTVDVLSLYLSLKAAGEVGQEVLQDLLEHVRW